MSDCDITIKGDRVVITMAEEVAEFYADALDKMPGDQGAATDAKELRRCASEIRRDEDGDDW